MLLIILVRELAADSRIANEIECRVTNLTGKLPNVSRSREPS